MVDHDLFNLEAGGPGAQQKLRVDELRKKMDPRQDGLHDIATHETEAAVGIAKTRAQEHPVESGHAPRQGGFTDDPAVSG